MTMEDEDVVMRTSEGGERMKKKVEDRKNFDARAMTITLVPLRANAAKKTDHRRGDGCWWGVVPSSPRPTTDD